ncbi:MAG: carbon-nitrogen hydrolase family protein [Alphaproteobacteria bacterium]|nr:MAG: carbon-nitrogen hydrolase family protein [Alphaproteobacteria bacterium]
MTDTVHIACLQTRPRARFEDAIAEAMPMAEEAVRTGAAMLFLPEYCGGLASRDGALVPPAAEEAVHPVLAAFRAFAGRRRVWVMLGSIAVTGPKGKILNRGYMIDDTGQVCGHYDKIHLFDVDLGKGQRYRESAHVVPGERAVVHDTPLGRIGHTICYDLRFPQLYRSLAASGAEILTCPAAFTRTTGEAHWHVLNRARAIENGAFMISPCAVGPVPGGGESYGHSLIVDPWGKVLADGGSAAGVVAARIDPGEARRARARIPSLSHDRQFTLPRAAHTPGRKSA